MKQVLIFSYHFPPLNLIASYRAKSFADYFNENGLFPSIVTLNWDNPDQYAEEIKEDRIIYRLPLPAAEENLKGWKNKFRILRNWVSGYFDPGDESRSVYHTFKEFAADHLVSHRYDMLMGIYSPHHHLKLTYELSRKHDIPYVLDFRDLWDNRVTDPSFSPGVTLSLKYYFIRKYWKKWIRNAVFFTTISDPWVKILKNLSGQNGYRITHGYEKEIDELSTTISTKEFLIAYTGTFSKNQDIKMLGSGLSLFLKRSKSARLKVIFLGSRRKDNFKGSSIDPAVALAEFLDEEYFESTPRVDRNEVLKILAECALLLMPTYRGYNGTYSGKLFEYIGVRKNILTFPRLGSVIEELISETRSGFVADSAEEIAAYLDKAYKEWDENNSIKFEGIEERIREYSRRNQAEKISNLILRHLEK